MDLGSTRCSTNSSSLPAARQPHARGVFAIDAEIDPGRRRTGDLSIAITVHEGVLDTAARHRTGEATGLVHCEQRTRRPRR